MIIMCIHHRLSSLAGKCDQADSISFEQASLFATVDIGMCYLLSVVKVRGARGLSPLLRFEPPAIV